MTRGLAASEDHVQNTKQKEGIPRGHAGRGSSGQWGMGEMRLWRLLEAEMRLPGQRGPSRSLLRRPRHGGGLGRCENEGLQPWAGQTGC